MKEQTLEANLRIQKKESPVFDLIHPELFRGVEGLKNREDIAKIKRLLEVPVPVVLDVGAGTGRLTKILLSQGFLVKAIDISPDMLKILRERFEEDSHLEIFEVEIEDYLSLLEKKVDLICFSAMLHHLHDYLAVIKTAVSKLQTGGFIFINHEPVLRLHHRKRHLAFWMDKMDSILFRVWLLLFKGKLLPVTDYSGSDPHGIEGIDESLIVKTLEKEGCQIVSFEKYAPRKTKLVTFLDRHLVKSNHQFRLIARKSRS